MYEWYASPANEKKHYKDKLDAELDRQVQGTIFSRMQAFDYFYNNHFKDYAKQRRKREARSP